MFDAFLKWSIKFPSVAWKNESFLIKWISFSLGRWLKSLNLDLNGNFQIKLDISVICLQTDTVRGNQTGLRSSVTTWIPSKIKLTLWRDVPHDWMIAKSDCFHRRIISIRNFDIHYRQSFYSIETKPVDILRLTHKIESGTCWFRFRVDQFFNRTHSIWVERSLNFSK